MDKNKILAEVNGKKITGEDYNIFINSINPKLREHLVNSDQNKEVIEELIHHELIYQDAIENGKDKEEEFQKVLDQAKKSLLLNYTLGKLLSNIEVTEKEIEDFYNNHKEHFTKDQTVRASHILVDDLKKAEEIYNRIKDGADFSKEAKNNSTCPSKENGGDLGIFSRGQMVKEFEDACFNMEVGEVSKPVKTQFGYHIIKLVEKNKAQEMTLEESRDHIIEDIRRQKEQEIYKDKISLLREKSQIKYID